eukprot:3421670-Alexandrium_andersonii.AAC.1
MSASLVGSEMCIRDRFTGRNDMSSSAPVPGGRGQSPPTWMAGALSTAAVSYTHLTLPTICSV